MPTTYATPDQCRDLEILADLDEVLAAHERFAPILKFGLKIDILLASSDDDGPALSKNGAHPDAYIGRRSGKERAQGLGDVLIHVDAGRYRDKPRRERLATLAHELYHIAIQTHKETTLNDDNEEVIVDAADLDAYARPVVKLIADDWMVTGFREVAEWYGPDSCEVKSYRAMGKLLAQAVLPFMAGDDRGESGDGEPDEVTLTLTGRKRKAGAS